MMTMTTIDYDEFLREQVSVMAYDDLECFPHLFWLFALELEASTVCAI